ncbi:hypothetical protein DPMN_189627 [Dreissena polymorpha]|uniref:Uncharacterized protein n=1 Tax=Dreissena polymorpha TaxID=45954 RepID=A0A9D4ICD6_DREPO|nr:hypothetical protein DPMN_189627 [Dreissena polymorpha]
MDNQGINTVVPRLYTAVPDHTRQLHGPSRMVISSRIVTDKDGFNFPKTAVLATRTPKDNAGRSINNRVRHKATRPRHGLHAGSGQI